VKKISALLVMFAVLTAGVIGCSSTPTTKSGTPPVTTPDKDKKDKDHKDKDHKDKDHKDKDHKSKDHKDKKDKDHKDHTVAPAAGHDSAGVDGNTAWAALVAGNQKYHAGDVEGIWSNLHPKITPAHRSSCCGGQKPHSIILSCADSRVPPELLFGGQGVGELFVIRVAGNIVDAHVLGTIEYGVEHLHSRLLVILGHQFCGAVKASLGPLDGHPSNIGELLKPIARAQYAKGQDCNSEADRLEAAVKQNVRNVKVDILEQSPYLKQKIESEHLKVVLAEYSLETGLVTEISQ